MKSYLVVALAVAGMPSVGSAPAARGESNTRIDVTPVRSERAAADVAIVQTFDVRYATVEGVDAKFHSLDIYAPKGAKAAPVVVFVHGGYWKAGDKSNRSRLPEFFCGRGCVFVSVDCRLSPAAKHPAHVRRREMPEPFRSMFERLDTDCDGVVSEKELAAYYRGVQSA